MILNSYHVKQMAFGRWPEILSALCGLTEAQTTPGNRGMPCPYCCGHDRYEFKNIDDGFYMCRGCGAGDGFSMVMKMNRCDFREALLQIAAYMSKPVAPCRPASISQPKTDTAAKAQAIYNRSPPADKNHPYLIKKKLPYNYFRQFHDNLLIPVYSQGFAIVNLQFILPDGSKFFLRGGRVKGGFTWYGDSSSRSVYVTEGAASALSIHRMYNVMAVAAFSVSNIESVARFLRTELPENRLVLFIDNDRPTEKRPWRPGSTALYAHRFFDAIEIPPTGCDASDVYLKKFHVEHGCSGDG